MDIIGPPPLFGLELYSLTRIEWVSPEPDRSFSNYTGDEINPNIVDTILTPHYGNIDTMLVG